MGDEKSIPKLKNIKKLNESNDMINNSNKSIDENNIIYSVNKIPLPNQTSNNNVYINNNKENSENDMNNNNKINEEKSNINNNIQIEKLKGEKTDNKALSILENYKIKYNISLLKNNNRIKLDELLNMINKKENKNINIYDKKILNLRKYIINKDLCYISPVDGRKIETNKIFKKTFLKNFNLNKSKSIKMFEIKKKNINTNLKNKSTDNIFYNDSILNNLRRNSSSNLSLTKKMEFENELYKENLTNFENKLFRKGINRELKY